MLPDQIGCFGSFLTTAPFFTQVNIANFKVAHKLITGSGSVTKLKGEVLRLGMKKPLIVTDTILQSAGVVKRVENELRQTRFCIYTGVLPEPEIYLVNDCNRQFREDKCDGLIAVGGGSAMDIAKAVSAVAGNSGDIADLFGVDLVKKKGPPVIAIPTTAGTGSEVTNIAILSDKAAQLKKDIVSIRIGILESTSQRDLGIAGMVGAILATKGAGWGFAAGIILCLLVYGTDFFKGEKDNTFSKDN